MGEGRLLGAESDGDGGQSEGWAVARPQCSFWVRWVSFGVLSRGVLGFNTALHCPCGPDWGGGGGHTRRLPGPVVAWPHGPRLCLSHGSLCPGPGAMQLLKLHPFYTQRTDKALGWSPGRVT